MSAHPGAILLVEDSADDVFLTQQAFTRNKITNEIVVARDGIEARDLLLPQDERPRLCPVIVLLDINMPRMGGLELLGILRADARTRSLPVIVLTASREDQDLVRSYDLGANSFVPKPVTPEEFLAAAKTLGVYWLGINKQPDPTEGSSPPPG